MKRILLLALVVCSTNANIFKCEVNGVTTYSQVPCAEDAEVTDYSREGTELPAVAPQAATSSAATETIDRLGNSVKKRDLGEKIKRLERQRDRQIANRDAEVAKIASQKGRYVQNLYGVAHEDKVNTSIIAATTMWNSRIEATDRELEQLRAEYNKL
ncbi:MAG: DUF4124 domain-containing protein [Pseudomonadota bacterium]